MDYTIIDAHAHLCYDRILLWTDCLSGLWKMAVRNLWEKSGKWFRPLW